MNYFHDEAEGISDPRSHPWTIGAEAGAKFVDFLKYPELIRESLEDFAPHKAFGGIDRFYTLVEWMSGPNAVWETTECYFRPPRQNSESGVSANALFCSGRLVFFCRDHIWTCQNADYLFTCLIRGFAHLSANPAKASIGYFQFPTQFVEMADAAGGADICSALGVRFYGFGATDEECFESFGAGVDALDRVLRDLNLLVADEGVCR